MKYVCRTEAEEIYNELLNEYKFSLEQLIELSGLGAAQAIAEAFPLNSEMKSCLFAIGPGDNGAKGLACARHIKHFGYSPVIFLVSELLRPSFINFQNQCEMSDIPCLEELPEAEMIAENYSFIVDAIYGNNFHPPIRPNSAIVLDTLMKYKLPICCIDIPSGWDTDSGYLKNAIQPNVVISDIVPKYCVSTIDGIQHYLAGRILPPMLGEKYELNLPQYPGHFMYVKIN
ncbi:hypothetical protein L9F63_010906 [Diploptera punctata]|uniref:NAD(P)H-hydrate epimerase n=1 Tax=Diploptera punctata TaxID=6984 RepID=A0AAD8AG18_DIPPU|nr:hypothetical protein L9F63_010906 [Diploptera punctata]